MNRFSGMLQAFVGMLVLLALDQFSKIWVRETIPLYEMTPLVPNFLDLTHVQNRGVSFSFLADLEDPIRIPLLVGVSLVAVVGMIYYLIRYRETLDLYTRLGLLFIIPGPLATSSTGPGSDRLPISSTSVGMISVFSSITSLTV